MTTPTGSPSPEALIILKALRDAVTKNLEKKRRLGHYIVIWQDGRPVLVGEDAPKPES
ncbi:hypothetical protein IMCC9480_3924 [Oxalobacteraceae bacterium IMCC9480]|nr:hypothetical protein IMCC9480_3924 [Oxalobacteraceae bacterium IMCC9480]